jgi:hypothetical protein
MADFIPAEYLAGGRVVARFRTTAAEQRDVIFHCSKTLFKSDSAVRSGRTFMQSFLLWMVIGFVLAVVFNLELKNWVYPIIPFIAGVLLGVVLLSLFGLYSIFIRKKKVLKLLKISEEFDDIVVTCHANGLSLATAAEVYYFSFAAIDKVSKFQDMFLLRRKLLALYVPERGFSNIEDRSFFLNELKRAVAKDRIDDILITSV